jgi:putative transcriptional regulator
VKNRLRELRAARRWSQADLADRCHVSRQAINAIETERYDPSLPLAFTIADVFGLTIEEIFRPDRTETTGNPAEPRSGRAPRPAGPVRPRRAGPPHQR